MTKRRPIGERLMERVTKTPTCWLFSGHLYNGYGKLHEGGSRRQSNRYISAHRAAYELFVGPIPEGLHIDHLCRVRNCVNPAHLEAVTPTENFMRSDAPAAMNARLEVCKKEGHPLTPDNIVSDTPGHRRCRKCRQAWERDRNQRRVAKARLDRQGEVAA